jgi:hypothetical protein
MKSEVRLLYEALREKLTSDNPEERDSAADAVADWLRVRAREERIIIKPPLAVVEGVPIYPQDFELGLDLRYVWWERFLMLHGYRNVSGNELCLPIKEELS